MAVIVAGVLIELRIILAFRHVNPILSQGIFNLSIKNTILTEGNHPTNNAAFQLFSSH